MRAVSCCVAVLVSGVLIARAGSSHTYKPSAGYVPDEVTAIKIAVAVWEPIYGAAAIAKEKPYHATLHGRIWTVTGSLPRGATGGVALAEMSKEDGRITHISHGR